MSTITIKLNDNFNIHTVNNEIKYAFNNNENVIFIFLIQSSHKIFSNIFVDDFYSRRHRRGYDDW